ncbi:hypothetical protein [Sphingomonas sp. Leaf34]|uniref:hypothetical protein n=1 Tax=Sphingomonas sp. Leaf34 TaxID=1736216 RepID=UPI000B07A53F|nr:hypothetical protein [Sphingomonas sp. Leaf34]
MATVLCAPQSFSVNASSEQATAPASNALTPFPGVVWRSNGLSTVYVTLATSGAPIDLIALAGSNLRSTDTVRVRGSSAAAMTSPVFDVTVSAWSGTAPNRGATTLIQLASAVTPAFVRIDITSTGNPVGYVEVQRLVVGKKVVCDGVDIGCEHGLEDQSQSEDILGSTVFDEFRVRDSWKATISNVKETDYWTIWVPFLRGIGKTRDFLFVPETDPAFLQNQAIMGRITSNAKGSYRSSDLLLVDLNILQV